MAQTTGYAEVVLPGSTTSPEYSNTPVDVFLQFSLMKKLSNLKMEEGGNLRTHLNELMTAVEELREAGLKVDDLSVASYMLTSLPNTKDWRHISWITQETIPNGTQSISAFVKQRLLAHYDMELVLTTSNRLDSIVQTGTRVIGSMINIQCYDCCNFGHRQYSKECPNFKRRVAIFGMDDVVKRGGLGPIKGESGGLGSGGPASGKRGQRVTKTTKHQDQASTSAVGPTTNEPIQNIPLVTPFHKASGGFYLTTTCTQHMVPNKKLFTNYVKLRERIEVKTLSGATIWAIGHGDITVPAIVENKTRTITFTNALHVPDIKMNCISVSQLAKLGARVELTREKCIVKKDGVVIFTGSFTPSGAAENRPPGWTVDCPAGCEQT